MRSLNFQRNFLLLLVAIITGLFFSMTRSFLEPLLFAAIFSSLLRPLYVKLRDKMGGREKLASMLSLLVFVLMIILPLAGFGVLVAKEAVNVTQNVKPWVQDNMSDRTELMQKLETLPGYHYIAPYEQQIKAKIGGAVSGMGNLVLGSASAITAGTFVLLMNFVIMCYAMFFFFIDGPALLNKILYYMPLKHADEKKLLDGFRSMARASIKGIVIIGAVQGALGGIAMAVAGIPSSLFWGTVMAVASVIPNVGAALVWLPACIYLFIKGQTVAAVALFLWCSIVVATIDNFLRPILVGKDTQVHELLILVSTLGGLSLMGLEGFILGPAVALLFVTIWEIYGITFKDFLPKVGRFDDKPSA